VLVAQNTADFIVEYLACLRLGHVVALVSACCADQIRALYGDADDLHPDLALLLPTSGSTGNPKVVRLSHRNLESNADAIVSTLALSEQDRALTTLPAAYSYGLSVINSMLTVGGTLVLTSDSVTEPALWDLARRQRVTVVPGVPYTFEMLERLGGDMLADLPSLRLLTCAGGRLPAATVRRWARAGERQGWGLAVMYGQTEATARLSYLPPHLLGSKLGSIGRGIPQVTLRVMGEDGQPVKPGDVGEIYAQGDNISPGYLDEPEVNAQKFVDGWLHTGDLATVDDDGFIFVVDRKADFIKSYGYRVSSQQVEGCIVEMPDVVAAAVIGEPDLVRGEAIAAFVVLRAGAMTTPRDIIAHCAERLPNYMVPRDATIIDRLPINAHGKVVKNELRKLAVA